jgi:hypothetical protein
MPVKLLQGQLLFKLSPWKDIGFLTRKETFVPQDSHVPRLF